MVDRIRQLLTWQQLSPTQFADLIGVGRPVVSHILSERNKPSLDVVQRVIAAFPTVSLPWLLSGAGEMLTDSATSDKVGQTSPAIAAAAPPAPVVQAPYTPPAPQITPPASETVAAAPATLAAAPGLASAPAVRRAPAVPAPPLARFVASKPTATRTTELPPQALPVPLAAPAAVPVAELAPAPALPVAQAAPLATAPPTVAEPSETIGSAAPLIPSDAAALLPFIAEPGKAIRRIVIFYRDGSFADYLPEG